MSYSRLSPVVFLIATACGDSSITTSSDASTNRPDAPGPQPIPGLTAITVSPANQTVVIDGDVAPQQDFTADGTFMDGHHEDVTSRVGWQVEKAALGFMTGAHFTGYTAFGGRTLIIASNGAISGSTQLTIVVRKQVNDPQAQNLPPNPGPLFNGPADASRNPNLVYPNDNVLLPPNMAVLEVHFRPATGNTLFEVAFKNAVTDVKVFTRCVNPANGGCIYTLTSAVWLFIAETNRGGEPVAVTVLGTDDNGSKVGTSAAISMSFSRDDIFGGIYYWGIVSGAGNIFRYDFAGTQTAAEKYLGGSAVPGGCIGCHALSRDGFKMVAEANGQNDGRLLLINVADKSPIVPFGTGQKSIFESWNPDATQYVAVYGDTGATDYNLMLVNGATGMKTASINIGGTQLSNGADHPDWSPDGTMIAFTKIGTTSSTLQRMHRGAIQVVTYNGTSWSAPSTLVPAKMGENRYYPAFSPDSKIVAFDISVCPGGDETSRSCNADGDPTATVYTVPAAGGTPVKLTNLNAPGKEDGGQTNLTNSFPKWCPFIFQRTGELGSRLMWITFSSGRAYGLHGTPPQQGTGDGDATTGKLVWMAGIDPDAALRNQDSSFAPFVLPYQGFDTSNHIAQWTQRVRTPIP
ncbi:MAG TPA: hypothetical protein VKE22_04720 [Haliangiales bacterium]|nr:hypothetical protein [Haliangiales bacterium]